MDKTGAVVGGGRRPHFVLVHGACHGGWCWYRIRTLMEASGCCDVTCFDLKGAGIDATDPNTIFTMKQYDEPLFQFLIDLPAGNKVILVGHSAGGLSLTHAIRRFAHKIELAIYVGATMLEHGFSTPQDVQDGCPDMSEYGDVTKPIYGLGPDQPPTGSIFRKEFQRLLLYQVSPLEDSTLASMLLRPAPLRALRGARLERGPGSEGVRRVYVKTAHDRVLKPEQQERMIRRWPPSEVLVVDSDHSPFFSAPAELFHLLLDAASA